MRSVGSRTNRGATAEPLSATTPPRIAAYFGPYTTECPLAPAARVPRSAARFGLGYRLDIARVEAAHRYDDVPVERAFAFVTDTANWPRYWPGFVRLEEGSRWGEVGATARLVTRLLGRERKLTMTVTEFEANRLVAYSSTQPGLPDARHERHFEPTGQGFVYRLVVEYEPRDGVSGLFDRLVVARGIRRAFESTFEALDREFASERSR